ncbi:uncharacterized protein FOMMEDRAFT_31171 [Fomitiporia mediterranea MF3/22]|uniref:uncharacterized protein n=1 Tax=Fomitiporia mediterranea (strain MF3/22) TaxID=694068 RepID=UPI00044076E5|nr:uncharacterized protein FOMMEDRAFT_31171 [Fomitiporia mediterranea MF3/22]EJC99450.1 hypothetical protein FOMMEDRAFT_31171 [Fomitiporia mediterranea MF3/22]
MYFKPALISVIALLGSASVASAAAAASASSIIDLTAGHSKRQVQEISGEIGCSAKGPLSGPWAIELFTCQPEANLTCQATDSSGCTAGDATALDRIMVIDPTTGTPLSGGAATAMANFSCPDNGLIICSLQFGDNGTSSGNFGMRIVNTSDIEGNSTDFSNATYGGDNSTSSANTTDSSTMPSDSSNSTASGGPTDSASESGNPANATDTDSGMGSETGSGAPSSTDSGTGSETGSGAPSGTESGTDSGTGTDTGSGAPTGTESGMGSTTSGVGDPVPTQEEQAAEAPAHPQALLPASPPVQVASTAPLVNPLASAKSKRAKLNVRENGVELISWHGLLDR